MMTRRSIWDVAAGGAVTLLVVVGLSACVSSQPVSGVAPTASPTLTVGSSSPQTGGSGNVSAAATPTQAAAKVPASDSKKAGAFVVSIAFTPTPARTGNNTLDALVTDAQGQPVSDAIVSFDIDMTNMSHGKNVIAAQAAGGGHYTGKLFFMMPGPWRVIVSVSGGGETGTARFDFNVK